MFLEECKYIWKGKNVTRYITDDLEISSHNSDESDEGQIKTKYPIRSFFNKDVWNN